VPGPTDGPHRSFCVLGELPFVIGVQSGLTREVLQPGTVMVGVRFRPGAAAPALRTPAGEMVDPDRAAATAGYADQAHLARESIAITGVAPSALLAGIEHNCGENHNHAPTYQPLLRAAARPAPSRYA